MTELAQVSPDRRQRKERFPSSPQGEPPSFDESTLLVCGALKAHHG
jgi:hypothetical protein